jgi:nitrous oxide reductase accessory protein NosL
MTRLLLVLLLLTGCGKRASDDAARPITAESLHGHDCAVCGMVVDEQPAPRGQVRHRDGSRAYACSIGDLRAYVQAPNPKGAPTHVWVEDLGPGWKPSDTNRDERPWIPASEATFVVGFPREGVMGLPAASFKTAADASRLGLAAGRDPVGWRELETTPFGEAP